MATFYLDYEGGNDNYAGTSFALLASGTDGAITSTTFSSASASFPNDGSLINQYLSIFNGTIYAVYRITAWVSSTSLTIAALTGGTALANTSARQYYIGGRWKTTISGATAVRLVAGDTVRLMASPDPTLVGSATWTGGGRPLSVTVSSSTNATPIAITTSGAHGLTAGDYVSIVGHTTNTNANGVWKVGTVSSSTVFTIVQMDGTNTTGNGVGSGGNATKINNCVVKLASPVTQNIALCGGLGQKPAWTASANVTTTQQISFSKEGYSSTSIAIAAAFTTGKAAYYTLPSTLNLSGYQQVTFWVRLQSGSVGAAGQTYLALCTDTIGDVVAHQCNVPALGAATVWVPVTVDLGTNMNSAIKSVALYVATDLGAQTFYIDNIVACKAASSADSLSLTSLVSKSDGTGDEAWYAVQNINYDVVMLANDNTVEATSTNIRGYNGATETVNTYKRETIKTVPVSSFSVPVQGANDSGSAGNLITFSGGWDRVDMSTQSGQTWFDGQNGFGYGFQNSQIYVSITRVNFCRYNLGITHQNANNNIGTTYVTGCGGSSVQFSGATNSTATNIWCNNNSTGMAVSGVGIAIDTVKTSANCYTAGTVVLNAYSCSINSLTTGNCPSTSGALQYSTAVGCYIGSFTSSNGVVAIGPINAFNCLIGGGSTTGSTTAAISSGTNATIFFLNNFTINETTEVSTNLLGGAYVYSNRHDNTDNNSWVFSTGGTINQQTSVVDSPATTSWKMSPTSASVSATIPLRLKLGTVVCGANTLVTVTARMRRSNTGLTMRLVCPAGQISGVTSDVTSDMTASANTWETVTITFTPTKAGGVDIYAYAFGGTTYSGYVCNLTASQA